MNEERSHNLVTRSSFKTHPSITESIVFYLLRNEVTILSFGKQKIKHYQKLIDGWIITKDKIVTTANI